MTAPEIRYRWQLLRAGPLKLDGGSMFGVVPKVVWSKNFATDEQNRISLAHNCLLLERPVENGTHRILIEAGSGDKLDAKIRGIFGLSDETVATAVERVGVACDQINAVIATHLHFDHCGGLTRWSRDGETPDWQGKLGNETRGVIATFPNAPVFVQQREWNDATANQSHMTRTYLKENLEPLRDRLKLLDAPLPFPRGYIPAREELPMASLNRRMLEIIPGISVFIVPGHTWGQQAVSFTDQLGRMVVFTPDLIPTRHHVGAAYNMAYDVEPYISSVTRRWYLKEAVVGDWLLVLDHEPGNPCFRARRDGKGWYELVEENVSG